MSAMNTNFRALVCVCLPRTLRFAGPVVVWAVWAAMTVAIVLFVRQFPRHVPYQDDFNLVSVMTGTESVSLHWAWAQHNEHRPMVSRLILAGLARYVANDFRTGKYFSVALLSAAAAGVVIVARKLRGSTTLSDAVLPLSILTLAQTETLVITFAMNLILTAIVSFALIATVALARPRRDWATVLTFGLLLALLPLTSGVVMLPPLFVWIAGYVAWDWWARRPLGRAGRTVGVVALMLCSAVTALFFSGYVSPPYHPPAPSLGAFAATTLQYLSLAIAPNAPKHWEMAGLFVVFLIVATLVLLVKVALHAPDERVRAAGMIAILMAMCTTACAVGYTRSALGSSVGLATRYVTITAPLLGAIYFAWLAHGGAVVRRGVHVVLFVLVCMAVRDSAANGLRNGAKIWNAERRVEQNLIARLPADEVVRHACRYIHSNQSTVREGFGMLKRAGLGAFIHLNDDRVAASTNDSSGARR